MNTIDDKLNYLVEHGGGSGGGDSLFIFYGSAGSGSTTEINYISASGISYIYDENYFVLDNNNLICRKDFKFRGYACLNGTYGGDYYIKINNITKEIINLPEYNVHRTSGIIEVKTGDVISLTKKNTGSTPGGTSYFYLKLE